MYKSIIGTIIGGAALYLVAAIAYSMGRDSVTFSEEAPEVLPEQKPPSTFGMLRGIRKIIKGKSKSVIADIIKNPNDIHLEAYEDNGSVHVIINKEGSRDANHT